MHDAVVVALTTPVKIGIYREGRLVEALESDENTSEALPKLFEGLLQRYEFSRLVYANGPGSFLAIKITYIFLRTIAIVKRIPLYGVDAFYFNGNRPIKAVGKLFFVKTSSAVETVRMDEVPAAAFTLPGRIDFQDFSKDAPPYYGIGAIG